MLPKMYLHSRSNLTLPSNPTSGPLPSAAFVAASTNKNFLMTWNTFNAVVSKVVIDASGESRNGGIIASNSFKICLRSLLLARKPLARALNEIKESALMTKLNKNGQMM